MSIVSPGRTYWTWSCASSWSLSQLVLSAPLTPPLSCLWSAYRSKTSLQALRSLPQWRAQSTSWFYCVSHGSSWHWRGQWQGANWTQHCHAEWMKPVLRRPTFHPAYSQKARVICRTGAGCSGGWVHRLAHASTASPSRVLPNHPCRGPIYRERGSPTDWTLNTQSCPRQNDRTVVFQVSVGAASVIWSLDPWAHRKCWVAMWANWSFYRSCSTWRRRGSDAVCPCELASASAYHFLGRGCSQDSLQICPCCTGRGYWPYQEGQTFTGADASLCTCS